MSDRLAPHPDGTTEIYCEKCGHQLHRYRDLRLCDECELRESDRLAEIEARLRAAGPWTRATPELDKLLAHAPTDLRDLLAVAKAARDVCQHWQERGDGYCTARLAVALRAALANLEGGA